MRARHRPSKASTLAEVLALILVALASAGSIGVTLASQDSAAVRSSDATAKALAEFIVRVDEYARLHRSAAGSLPPMHGEASVTEVWAREKLLADTIRARRPRAQQGDLFTAAVTPVLVGIVHEFLSSPEGAAAKERIVGENPASETPPIPVVLTVNGPYVHGASFSMMPPTLLMRLPPLPEEVEYRFVGRHLLFRDTSANIILDYLDLTP